MVDPIDYGAPLRASLLTGLQGGTMLQGLGIRTQQMRQAQAQQEAQQQFQRDWQAAYSSGDPAALDAIVAKYPQQMETVQKAIGFRDDNHRMALGNAARDLRIAAATGNPEAFAQMAMKNRAALQSVGSTPEELIQQYQQDPQGTQRIIDVVGIGAMGVKEYYAEMGQRETRAETARSHRANESLTARGQNVQMRGQDISASTARRGQDITIRGQDISAETTRRGQDLTMQRYATTNGGNGRDVQLADGRTVRINGKVHGAGANAFYEGIDDNGNTLRIPVGAIAAPATSAAAAGNYAMKKDLDAIAGARPDDLGALTGMTGGTGSPALGADYRSRWNGKEQRQIYNSAQRIQGRMQNQSIAAARDMGASGINTVEEAKMYFKGAPQLDFSSPEALKKTAAEIQEYTDNYNRQYNVSLDNAPRKYQTQNTSTQPPVQGYQSLWGD